MQHIQKICKKYYLKLDNKNAQSVGTINYSRYICIIIWLIKNDLFWKHFVILFFLGGPQSNVWSLYWPSVIQTLRNLALQPCGSCRHVYDTRRRGQLTNLALMARKHFHTMTDMILSQKTIMITRATLPHHKHS